MGENYELRFAGLRAGGTLAYYLTTDAITGGPQVVEFLASRESTQRRFKNRVKQSLPVEDDRKALTAFRAFAYVDGESSDNFIDSLETMTEFLQ